MSVAQERSELQVGGGPLSEQDYRDQADFRSALRHFLRVSEQNATAAGVTPQQHLLLILLRGHPAYPRVSVGELVESLQAGQSGVSLLVDRCVKRGLVVREEDPSDRRRAILRLTDTGQQVVDQVTHANRQVMSGLEGVLFRESLREALQRYAGAAAGSESTPTTR